MPKVELDKIERYLVEQTRERYPIEIQTWLVTFIRQRFAELRAREEAKKQCSDKPIK